MNRKSAWLAILLAFGLASCGGEGSGLAGGRNGPDTGTDPDTETPSELASLELLASTLQMQSDGSNTVTLTAIAKDSANNIVSEVPVSFSASSGTVTVLENITNENGNATAEVRTGGDPTNRTITVTATAGEISDSVNVSVIGSSLQIQGPSSLVIGATGDYTAILSDSGGVGIGNRTIELTSSNGNTLSATSLTTDSNGRVRFTLSGTTSGADTLTARALPDADGNFSASTSTEISVSGDSFQFTAPNSGTEITLGAAQNVTVQWEKSGVPQAGEEIQFATTRGTLSTGTATTDASGNASVSVSANTAGPAVVTATNSEGTSARLTVEFVADTADVITLQSDPGVIGPNETSTITATVLDPNDNRVKNAVVEFTLTDSTGGSLSTASAVTDSLGRAQTIYTASSATSADDGVTINAKVVKVGNTSTLNCTTTPADADLCSDTNLTVAGRALFITFGTGNSIVENASDTTYTKDYTVFVSDASGKGVADTNVDLRMLSTHFIKGDLLLYVDGWGYNNVDVPIVCISEDNDGDGVLDPGEDYNTDGELTPGNVAVVSPGSVTTDESGAASFAITYPQNYAMWVIGRITASASVAGSESRSSSAFYFPASAEDLAPDQTPPNVDSPYGTDVSTCLNAN